MSKSKRPKSDAANSPAKDPIFENLNAQQAAVVATHKGPILCVAGAGSGKTTTLTRRLAHMLRSGIPAESILLLTFTRAAAGEMLKRARALHPSAEKVSGGTFHSVAVSVLRQHGRHVGVDPAFTVIDPSDSEDAIASVMRKMRQDGGEYPRPRTVLGCVSYAINTRSKLVDVVAEKYPLWSRRVKFFKRASRNYARYKRDHNLLDFDDLLVSFGDLLADEVAGPKLRERWRYVMVYEHQDSNALQLKIISGLAGQAANVMVVGDPAQAIYGFRGSAPKTLFRFLKRYPSTRQMPLEINYRSTAPILRAANAIDRSMHPRFDRELRPARTVDAQKPALVEARDYAHEAKLIAKHISRSHRDGHDYSDHAILIRSMAMGRFVETELLAREIPYVVRGGLKITDAAHVKDLLSVGRVCDNVQHEPAWLRLSRLAPRVGPATAHALVDELAGVTDLQACLKRLRAFATRRGLQLEPVAAAVEAVVTSSSLREGFLAATDALEPLLSSRYADDWKDRKRDLEAVAAIAGANRKLRDFLTAVTLDNSFDRAGRLKRKAKDTEGAVTISTIHSAKGLEFPVVHIPHFVDGSYPIRYAASEAAEQEELRGLYVAITRARDGLFLYRPLVGGDRDLSLDESPYWATLSRHVRVVPVGAKSAQAARG